MCVVCGNSPETCVFAFRGSETTPVLGQGGGAAVQAAPELHNAPYFVKALIAPYSWVVPRIGEGTVITYGWRQDLTTGLYLGATNPRALNNTEREQVRTAFALWSAVADVSFVEINDGTTPTIQFAAANMSVGGYAALTANGSSIWVDSTNPPLITFAHEIGHALGLKHPGNYYASSGGEVGPFLSPLEDNTSNTVMSYNGDEVDSIGVFDIAAAHYLFGPNKTVRTENNIYKITPDQVAQYIWDAGGNDTISAENQNSSVTIDLREGHQGSFSIFSSVSNFTIPGQFIIGYGTIIENAVGSSNNDYITGNEVNNRLDGRAGNDTLIGGDGNDTLIGGAGEDMAVFSGFFDSYSFVIGEDNITVTSRSGEVDQIREIETLSFGDRLVPTSFIISPPPPPVKPDPFLTARGGWVVERDAGGVSQLVYSMKLTDATGWTTTSDKPVSFFVMTGSNGTAKAGTDYVPLKQWVTIAPGQSGVTVAIDVLGDKIYEGNKTIELVISDLQGTSLAWQQKSNSVYGLVVDNDIPPQFSIVAYRALNPDVAAAYGNDATAMAWHYLNYGRAEGRAASGFSPEAYAALNPDLFAAFGLDENALINHYQQYGRAEGRATYGFDAISYSALNPDLRKAFWENRTALVQHYIDYGRAEGRATLGYDREASTTFNSRSLDLVYSPPLEGLGNIIDGLSRDGGRTNGFDAETYAILNPDLLGAFGMNHEALIKHYWAIGQSEHRATFLVPDGGNLISIGVAGMVDDGLM